MKDRIRIGVGCVVILGFLFLFTIFFFLQRILFVLIGVDPDLDMRYFSVARVERHKYGYLRKSIHHEPSLETVTGMLEMIY
jgi:hypothetical protein